jgi:mediator of RNA polymerase II transcription subunit 31
MHSCTFDANALTRANPHYLLHLATLTTPNADGTNIPLLTHPPFIAYLEYLLYFTKPPYLKYLTYPGPTLKNLELLQSERFRREVLSPNVVAALIAEGSGAFAAA